MQIFDNYPSPSPSLLQPLSLGFKGLSLRSSNLLRCKKFSRSLTRSAITLGVQHATTPARLNLRLRFHVHPYSPATCFSALIRTPIIGAGRFLFAFSPLASSIGPENIAATVSHRAIPTVSDHTMASCTELTCNHCAFKIESWDDGSPYLRGVDGKRHYFYHPGERFVWEELYAAETGHPVLDQKELLAFVETRAGNERHYLCMHCGRQTQRDPEHDPLTCTRCRKRKLRLSQRLEGRTCPKCSKGTFTGRLTAIS